MAHVFRILAAHTAFIELGAKLDGGGVAGGIRPSARPGTGPMLLVGPDLAPLLESGPIIAGQGSYPGDDLLDPACLRAAGADQLVELVESCVAVLIEPDVGGVGEAPVVANVDLTRVSDVRGRLGDVLGAERGVDEGKGIGRLCEVEAGRRDLVRPAS